MAVSATDARIIELLQEDGRRSNAQIARAIGVSEATVRRRVKMLIEDDVFTMRAVPDLEKFGFTTSAVININVQPNMLTTVADAIAARPETLFLAVSTGRYDILARVVVRDLNELRDFLEGFLAKVPGVRQTETLVLLQVRKRPLGALPRKVLTGAK